MADADVQCLLSLLKSRNPCVLINTMEEAYALEVVRATAVGAGAHGLVWSVTRGLQDAVMRDGQAIADTEHPAGALTHLATHTPANSVVIFLDLCAHLGDQRTLRCFRDLLPLMQKVRSTIVLIDVSDEIPAVVRSAATPMDLSFPAPDEIEQIIRRTLREVHEAQSIEIAVRREDLDAMIQNLQGLTRTQIAQAIVEIAVDDRRVDASDIKRLIAFKKRTLRKVGVLEPVETLVSLDDIGGLKNLKKWLVLRQNALSDEAKEFGVESPRGILMLGVQGAGKSLSAKAVATAWRRPLVRLDAGALFDRYIGESERRLRDALRQAEMMAPVVLWIDEVEKAFASAAAQSVDGGLGKRMFGALLTWMQEHSKPVFLIATANDVSALPPELLRKGRFDEVFFIDLPAADARADIIRIHLKRRNRDPELFEMDQIIAATEGYSGAEIEEGIKSAIYLAFSQNALLSTKMIVDALKNSPPLSVTMAERIAELRAWAQSRCAKAD